MTEEATVNLEINDIPVQAVKGEMLISAADRCGIIIPRFCHHKKLSIAANCRMCLVEVEKVPKPVPACATPVTEGMKVKTASPTVIAVQKGAMEMMLINHPLDCPICDQGGECELQDIAVGFGNDSSRFGEQKQVGELKAISPLIMLETTRCINCLRCVRFGCEIAGIQELGAIGRGVTTRIGTFVDREVVSELSGNIIDLCPVGALTSQPFRFSARAWELQQYPSIAPHDSVGSHVNIHVRRNRVLRVVPRENDAINDCWISDRDRFSYEGLYSKNRLSRPLVKRDGKWQESQWQNALDKSVLAIEDVVNRHGAEELGILVAPTLSLEEMYLAQKLSRVLGSGHIDYRVHQGDFSDQDAAPIFPWLGQSIASLEKLDCVLLIGSNVRHDQPIIAHRLRQAGKHGAALMCINPVDFDFAFKVQEKCICSPLLMADCLAGVLKAVCDKTGQAMPTSCSGEFAGVVAAESEIKIAKRLLKAKNAAVLLGPLATTNAQFSLLRLLTTAIAKLTHASFGYLPEAANTVGANLAGVLPYRGVGGKSVDVVGLDALAMLQQPKKAYITIGLDAPLDFIDPALVKQAFMAADFVLALTTHRSDGLSALADVMLPMAGFAESSGTIVNAEGLKQSFAAVVTPYGEARPAWRILRVLANQLELDGFDYLSVQDVMQELATDLQTLQPDNRSDDRANHQVGRTAISSRVAANELARIGDLPMFAVDTLVRYAPALQQTAAAAPLTARINLEEAARLGIDQDERIIVRQGDNHCILSLVIDVRVPLHSVWIPFGVAGSEALGAANGTVVLERLQPNEEVTEK